MTFENSQATTLTQRVAQLNRAIQAHPPARELEARAIESGFQTCQLWLFDYEQYDIAKFVDLGDRVKLYGFDSSHPRLRRFFPSLLRQHGDFTWEELFAAIETAPWSGHSIIPETASQSKRRLKPRRFNEVLRKILDQYWPVIEMVAFFIILFAPKINQPLVWALMVLFIVAVVLGGEVAERLWPDD